MADFLGLMKQAAQLQSKMQAMQAELDLIEVEGTAGGGTVTITITAKGDLKAVKIDDSLLKAAVGRDMKGKLSLAGYSMAIAKAFVSQWISGLLYVTVALMWLIPDRRIERRLSSHG